MNLTFLGQSGFHVQTNGHSVLIDPFLTGNPLAVHSPEEFSPSFIVLTHAHADHVGDTEAIAGRSGATVVSSNEIAAYLAKKGLKTHGMNPGGSRTFPFGKLKFTPAWHSSSFEDGAYGGMPMGVILEAENKRVYHAGDTALFGDMALIGRGGLDATLLPIGDNFTMGPEDALEAVKLLEPKLTIPMHYNTWEILEQDPEAFKAAVETQGRKCVILEPGQSLEL